MSKLGIALSGGGAKGAAHIGVLQALKEENIDVQFISGTSSGSIIAALYACGYTPKEILKMFSTYCKYIADYDKTIPLKLAGMLFTGKVKIKGFAKGNRLESTIYKYCEYKNVHDISDIKVPLAIPTVDLATGEIIYYLSKRIGNNLNNMAHELDNNYSINYTGNLASIVRASSSFPGVFEPKILNRRVLVDGGVRVNTPVNILKKMGANKVIAVSFDTQNTALQVNIVSVAMKSFDIMTKELNRLEINDADLIITPKLSKISLLECDKTQMIANAGYIKTKEIIDDIKKLII